MLPRPSPLATAALGPLEGPDFCLGLFWPFCCSFLAEDRFPNTQTPPCVYLSTHIYPFHQGYSNSGAPESPRKLESERPYPLGFLIL